jgi:hypothetical protein
MILFSGHNIGTEKCTIFLIHYSARKDRILQRSHKRVNEKDPNNVTTEEFKKLGEDFDDKISNFNQSSLFI